MKIFVSYARVDKPYCIRIIETLHAHDVWYDQRLYAGQEWWKEILRRLDWCEVFIFLLSPASVDSLYCRRELDIAQHLKRHIIPVLIDGETVLPDKLREWQYVDLSDNLTVESVAHLLNAVLVVERQRAARQAPPPSVKAQRATGAKPAELVKNGVQALEKGEYETALRLLRQAKTSGYQSRFVRLDKLLRAAEAGQAERRSSREVQREYQHIVTLFAFESTRQLACEALVEFQKEFGDYDPKNLRRFCKALPPAAPRRQAAANTKPSPKTRAGPQAAVARRRQANTNAKPDPKTRAVPQAAAAPAPPRQRLKPASPPGARPSPPASRSQADDAFDIKKVLPMLEWCDIPHGLVTISSIVGADEDFGEMTAQVGNFVMSKYPVTNAQFAIFAQAQDGYRNPRWWDFSSNAQRWFKLGKGLAKPGFGGEKRPRGNVNWYEAMAFANWLGSLLKMKISLPTIAQWQRAAKGDDDRYFPWGDEYQEEHCNTKETGIKMTHAS